MSGPSICLGVEFGVPRTAVAEANEMDANVSCSVVSANDRFQASQSNTQGPAVDPLQTLVATA